MYTLVINDAFPTIEVKDIVVASLKKLKHTIPANRYTGKFSMSDLNKVENTMYCTSMVNNGFKKLQSTPKTERLYFVLKSRATSCFIK